MASEDYRTDVDRLRKQRSILSRFSSHALRTTDLDELLGEACSLVSDALDIELVKVLELLPEKDEMLVRAGVNWNAGVVGHARFGAHKRSPSGYALQTDEPVVSTDVTREDRFDIPQLLIDHGVESMVNVVVRGAQGDWGVLEVDARCHRDFGQDDIEFLQNYANVLSAAIERMQLHRQLEVKARESEILAGELQHRVKNLIANIRALAHRTGATSQDLDRFAESFDQRLAVLDRTQDLLTAGHEIDIGTVLRRELDAHGVKEDARVRLSGPDLPVPPQTAQLLGIAFHELATNAVKYGAFTQDGELEVDWTMRGGQIRIRWRETGVLIKDAPRRQGYGSETIERGLPYMLGGTSELTFHPDGVEWRLSLPQPAQVDCSDDLQRHVTPISRGGIFSPSVPDTARPNPALAGTRREHTGFKGELS